MTSTKVGVVAWLTLLTAAACGANEAVVAKGPTDPPADPGPPAGSAVVPVASDTGDPGGDSKPWGIVERDDDAEFAKTIEKVKGMPNDSDLLGRVRQRGLSVVNVAWEDTGRAQNSALGPNISDLTLQVERKDPRGNVSASLMPVIRLPNFTDKTGDLSADKFYVRVNNERPMPADGDAHLESIPLGDFLKHIKAHATFPGGILGSGDLTAPRDSHYLMSAQAVFLPIPKKGKAEFNPALFNYQSAPGSPAVLSILVTREGTSMEVVENRPQDRDSSGRGQQIFFDNHGQKAAYTAERRSEVVARIESHGGPKNEDERSAIARGADVLFLIQVPLMHENRGRLGGTLPSSAGGLGGLSGVGIGGGGAGMATGDIDSDGAPAFKGGKKSAGPTMVMQPSAPPAPMAQGAPAATSAAMGAGHGATRGRVLSDDAPSDVEQAVLGHGRDRGAFDEGHGLRLVRDPKFPVRITVQFYKATSNGSVSDVDLDSIARSVGSVYEHADFVGSLVVPEGDPRRPTAWQKVPHEWFPW